MESENIYRAEGSAPLARRQAVGGAVQVKWEMTDAQGSVRVFVDGAGTATDRYDYTPFGEYLGAGTGTRTTTQGYSGAQLRQRFAGTTRDYTMTGLEDTPWRKMDSKAGRWTTPDPYNGSMSVSDPQSLNRYSYTQNDPVNFVDPSGLNMWSGGSGYGCDAAYGSCGGGWDGAGGASGMGGYGFSGGLFDSERFAPGSAGEARYESILNNGYDPYFRRFTGDVALQIVDRNGNVTWQGEWMNRPTLGAVWSAAANIAEGIARNQVRNELRGFGLEGHINLTANGAGFNFTVNPRSAAFVRGLLGDTSSFNSSSNSFFFLYHYNDAQCASGGCRDYRSLPGVVAGGSMQFVYNSGLLLGYVDRDRYNPRASIGGFLGHAFLEVIPNAISDVPNVPGVSFRGFPTRP